MDQFCLFCQSQPQSVESGIEIGRLTGNAVSSLFEVFGAEHQQGTEVEVIAYAACLIIDDGMIGAFACDPLVAVGISHTTGRSLQVVTESFQCHVSKFNSLFLGQ